MNSYLESINKQFTYYKVLGESTFDQLSEEELFWQPTSESNSIVIIVQHLLGNMLSRWTDFLTSDGEKNWRNRDQEFEPRILTKRQLIEEWNKGWNCLFDALSQLHTEDDLKKVILIRNEPHSIIEAIHRQLAHYPYHVGQIVFLGKMMKNENWISLSIPKNKSEDYNRSKFDNK